MFELYRSLRFLVPLVASNPPSPPQLSALSLHDALPIWRAPPRARPGAGPAAAPDAAPRDRAPRRSDRGRRGRLARGLPPGDRKSTRLNSSHLVISYAVFCLNKQTLLRNYGDRHPRLTTL